MNAKVAKIMEPKKILSSNVGSGGNVKEPWLFVCYVLFRLLYMLVLALT